MQKRGESVISCNDSFEQRKLFQKKKQISYNYVQLQNFPNSYTKRVLIIRIMIEKNLGRYNPRIQNQILLSA